MPLGVRDGFFQSVYEWFYESKVFGILCAIGVYAKGRCFKEIISLIYLSYNIVILRLAYLFQYLIYCYSYRLHIYIVDFTVYIHY